MRQTHNRLSKYIDVLNEEHMPKEHRKKLSKDYEELTDMVRRIRTLKEPVFPDAELEKRLLQSLSFEDKEQRKARINPQRRWGRQMLIGTAAVAAAALLVLNFPDINMLRNNPDIVYAMEQAMEEVKAYHGFLEVTETNALGETMTQSKREIWADSQGYYYIKEQGGLAEGTVTVNNGQVKWQLRPEEEAAYLFPAFPDPYRFLFELSNEVKEAGSAVQVETVGEERIAGRTADILEITPKGGQAYRLWIDKETKLPLQKLSAMQNAIQYKVTYNSIEFLNSIPEELLFYTLPEGYQEFQTNPEQIMNTLEEAESVLGFLPQIPEKIPQGYVLNKIAVQENLSTVRLYFMGKDPQKAVVIEQSRIDQKLAGDPNAILGKVNGNLASLRTESEITSVRWQESGMEYCVLGSLTREEMTWFVEGISEGELQLPDWQEETQDKPQIKIEVDLTVEENEQKSVDAGHSPWRLDPAFVTQVFASLLLSPEGITGDYPIPYEDIRIVKNNGISAKAEILTENSIATYVYLKRLVRQDDTGIWTVVGYDTEE